MSLDPDTLVITRELMRQFVLEVIATESGLAIDYDQTSYLNEVVDAWMEQFDALLEGQPT